MIASLALSGIKFTPFTQLCVSERVERTNKARHSAEKKLRERTNFSQKLNYKKNCSLFRN